MKAFEYRHVVGFQETNLVGNVYYVNHLAWQGRCREFFIREHAPDVLEQLSNGLAMVTLRCSCEYLDELFAFDEVVLRMTLGEMVQNRILMLFEYWRVNPGREGLIARGEQQIACLRREGDQTVATPIPASLREAARLYPGR